MLWFKKLFRKEELSQPAQSSPESTPMMQFNEIIPGVTQLHNEICELQRTKDTKKILQRLDELVTTAEANIDSISKEIDNFINTENNLRLEIKNSVNGTWVERASLLKLERVIIHRKNLQQRVEIFNQNIRVYMNMIARIQDISAMKMEGIDEDKIDAVWLDFKEHAEAYNERIVASDISSQDNIILITKNLEERIGELRKEIKKESLPVMPELKTEPKLEIKQPLLE